MTVEQVRAVQADTLRRYAAYLSALVFRGVNQKVNDDLTYLSRLMVRSAGELETGVWELPQ